MQIIHDPREYQQACLAWRARGLRSAVVPTMGALHAGHLALVDAATHHADRTSVTLFVNPSQFGPNEDFTKYPRTLESDAEACRERGIDLLFAPSTDSIYPQNFRTWVNVESLTDGMEGAFRPGHFRGVTTIVLKLLMLAQADCAVFGWKDAQQFIVLRRMVEDLAIPIEMIGVETVREPDGLALSSRNRYLTPEQRAAAPAMRRGLLAAAEAFASGEHNAAYLIAIVHEAISQTPLPTIDYIDLRALDTLEPQTMAVAGNSLLAAVIRLGTTRLLDNVRL